MRLICRFIVNNIIIIIHCAHAKSRPDLEPAAADRVLSGVCGPSDRRKRARARADVTRRPLQEHRLQKHGGRRPRLALFSRSAVTGGPGSGRAEGIKYDYRIVNSSHHNMPFEHEFAHARSCVLHLLLCVSTCNEQMEDSPIVHNIFKL